MPSLRERFLGQNGLDWLDRSYAMDWYVSLAAMHVCPSYRLSRLAVLGIWTLAWIASNVSVFERKFDLDDPLISHPHYDGDQYVHLQPAVYILNHTILQTRVSNTLNVIIGAWIPVIIVVVTGSLNRSLMQIHHGIIALCAGQYVYQ